MAVVVGRTAPDCSRVVVAAARKIGEKAKTAPAEALAAVAIAAAGRDEKDE